MRIPGTPRLTRAATLVLAVASTMHAQSRKIRVVGPDSVPVVFAFVEINGGTGQITDDNGLVSLGAGKATTVTVQVRRLGYQPFFGKIALPDTAAILAVVLPRIAQKLSEVKIEETKAPTLSLTMRDFYDRWTMRQKGLLSATFVGPEEIEARHPDRISSLLFGRLGISMKSAVAVPTFKVAYGAGGCRMAVVVDGHQLCPPRGCAIDNRPCGRGESADCNSVVLDDQIDVESVSGIEIYARGGNMPSSLHVNDWACGALVITTGSRK